MILLGVWTYLVITFFLTLIGIEKQNEGLKIFILSMLLTPIAALFYMATKKRSFSRINYSYCHECDYVLPVKMKHCPMCEEKGQKVKLSRYVSPYDLSDKVQIAEFA